jgi:hypothetical protein
MKKFVLVPYEQYTRKQKQNGGEDTHNLNEDIRQQSRNDDIGDKSGNSASVQTSPVAIGKGVKQPASPISSFDKNQASTSTAPVAAKNSASGGLELDRSFATIDTQTDADPPVANKLPKLSTKKIEGTKRLAPLLADAINDIGDREQADLSVGGIPREPKKEKTEIVKEKKSKSDNDISTAKSITSGKIWIRS